MSNATMMQMYKKYLKWIGIAKKICQADIEIILGQSIKMFDSYYL